MPVIKTSTSVPLKRNTSASGGQTAAQQLADGIDGNMTLMINTD